MAWGAYARGRTVRRQPGEMNKLEAQYALQLEGLRSAGVILWYAFDSIKLRLADKCFYTPDFIVMRATGEIEVHEVKGFMRDDANVKLKVAASLYPFKFLLIRYDRHTWQTEEK